MMRTVLYDSLISGHHSEFIDHLASYLAKENTNEQYCFLVHPEFKNKFPRIVESTMKLPNVSWYYLKIDEIESLKGLSVIKKSFKEFKLIKAYAKELDAKRVYLLYFNTFQLALGLLRPEFIVNGILFQQFSRMDKNTIKAKIKYFRKYLTTKLLTYNSAIDKIFVLNDQDTVTYFNNEFKTDKFEVLPDPIMKIDPEFDFDSYSFYKILKDKKILLHFGSLADRKGTLEIIQALKLIPTTRQKEYALLLAGRPINSEIEDRIKAAIMENNEVSKVQIVWDNTFISTERMKSLFEQCYAVLMPYKNPEASSGILGHAIYAGKPVIATGIGLLKKLVEVNELGVLVDIVSPSELAKAFLKVKPLSTQGLERRTTFIKSNSPDEFAKKLLLKTNKI